VISNRHLLIPAGFKEFVTLFKIGTFLGVLGGGVGGWLEHRDAADTLNSKHLASPRPNFKINSSCE
jgi:hypothetical protein